MNAELMPQSLIACIAKKLKESKFFKVNGKWYSENPLKIDPDEIFQLLSTANAAHELKMENEKLRSAISGTKDGISCQKE